MRKLAIALSKGGVGKTTTAINLSASLAMMGYRVLLVDLDTQGQVATSLGLYPRLNLADCLAERAPLEEILMPARQRLWVIAGGRGLAGTKREIARLDQDGEEVLSQALHPLEGQYDYVILDTAPSWDVLNVNALFYATEVLAPVSLEVLTLQGLIEFARIVTDIQQFRPALALSYVVPTFLDQRVRKSAEILGQVKRYFPAQLCQPIRYSARLSEAPGHGQTIFEYSPESSGAEDYQQLAERIVQNG